ncbi:barstar family protein [Actinosynnema sp. NPDC050436]|uniref:barstar family protein n=1 Tax=Actinosynnema sp. NPDC050436 TaxID=3155659 RepID=UPI0033F14A06
MDVELDGLKATTLEGFHSEMARLLDFGPYYGNNFSALWDRLSTDVERPVRLTWTNARTSRDGIGAADFTALVRILRRAEQQDRDFGLVHRLEVTIQDWSPGPA